MGHVGQFTDGSRRLWVTWVTGHKMWSIVSSVTKRSVAGCVCDCDCVPVMWSVQKPGYSTQMKPESLTAYEYPVGSAWQALFEQGLFERPQRE